MVNETWCPGCDTKSPVNEYDRRLEAEVPQIQFSQFVAGDMLIRKCPSCNEKEVTTKWSMTKKWGV